ncbi:MAG: TraM recognition domain-containing protein, partial [Fusobacterium sp.]|nr:TraM recognition domain-containing protein [Fusobacterium sp.]
SRLSDLILEKKETSLKIRLNYILDEFANIPCIENFDRYISVGRSKNIRFTLFLQNIGQLKKYGDKKEIILGNASNIVYLYSKEKETVNFIYEQVKDYINLKGLKKLDKDLGEAIMLLDRYDPYLAHLKDIDDVLASLNLEEVA